MKYSYFLGCQVPARVNYCDLAIRKVAKAFEIELVDLQGAACCGRYLLSIDPKATLVLSARIMALADKLGLDLMVLCNSCYAALTEAGSFLQEKPELLTEINGLLAAEGLEYKGKTKVKDVIQVFYHDLGLDKINLKVKKTFQDLKVAVQYGCHLLRPSKITKFDDPEAPHLLDDLVEVTKAKSIYWPFKLWCCGFPTVMVDEKLGMSLARDKLRDAKDAGAHCMVTTCPSCQITFDVLQPRIARIYNEQYDLPVLYYPQLLGLTMDLSPEDVGLNRNRVPTKSILKFLR